MNRERPPIVRGSLIAILVAAVLIVCAVLGSILFGPNAWSLMLLVVGGPVLMVAGILRLVLWANTRARLRGLLRVVGWGSLLAGIAQLALAAVRAFSTTIVVDVVFGFLGGAVGVALGVVLLRIPRNAMAGDEASPSADIDRPRTS
jgi:hypothetical protein